jgi:hypothetical protein
MLTLQTDEIDRIAGGIDSQYRSRRFNLIVLATLALAVGAALAW